MKVVLAQIEVFPGEIQKNLDNMWKAILQANRDEADVIAFPELCVGGYMVGDLYYDPDFIEELEAGNRWLYKKIDESNTRTFKIIVIYGNIAKGWAGEVGQDGRPQLFNCAWIIEKQMKGKTMMESVPKRLLPNYRFFDDKRYFTPGKTSPVTEVTLRDGTKAVFGLEVCEDVWHDDYPINPTAELALKGAEYVFNISASPYSYGKWDSRNRQIERTLQGISNSPIKFFFYVNNVGAQNNGKNVITFDGDSSVYEGDGVIVRKNETPFKVDMISYDTEEEYHITDQRTWTKERYQLQAILVGIKAMDQIMGNDKFPYIIGVSGGIDSAVVLCLLEQAVGKDRIRAYNLPSQYNSKETKAIAYRLCDSLDIPLGIVSIGDLAESTMKAVWSGGQQLIGSEMADKDDVLLLENVQAKTRGTAILSNLAGVLGGVMTNNGNKVEVALGYATLYGDVNGAIAPLGDLLKTEVWALAEYLNEKVYQKEVIPKELLPDGRFEIPLPPSAELKNNQIDPMKWGYHDALLAYLLNYKRGGVKELIAAHKDNQKQFMVLLAKACPDPKTIASLGYVMEKYQLWRKENFLADLDWFLKHMNRATFKRIQSPPIIVQSKSAFGFDHRESQVPWIRDLGKMWNDAKPSLIC
jgi:NAD+ synthase (glutamine-hydrolysing)